MSKIDEIEKGMKSIINRQDDNDSDWGEDHIQADELLIMLIRALTTEKDVEQIERIIAQFEMMSKWYA